MQEKRSKNQNVKRAIIGNGCTKKKECAGIQNRLFSMKGRYQIINAADLTWIRTNFVIHEIDEYGPERR